jgi:hypothetical protein
MRAQFRGPLTLGAEQIAKLCFSFAIFYSSKSQDLSLQDGSKRLSSHCPYCPNPVLDGIGYEFYCVYTTLKPMR